MRLPRKFSRAGHLLAISVFFLAFSAAFAVAFSSSATWAASGASQEARAHFDKATAAFALGRYPEAADSFEKAFEIRPDSALLYNAAQAHRLAGNRQRALILYQNYLRLYAKAPMRVEAEARIDELKKAIERDRVTATTPAPPSPAGASSRPSTPEPEAASASRAASAVDLRPPSPSPPPPTLVTRAPSVPPEPLTRKPLFWAAVAGGVAVATVVVLVLASGGDRNPSPSLGVVK
jgi:tetratricopeptide (TPR) repeat protein